MMQLTRRETWLAAGLGAFAVIWATFSLFVSPALKRMETLNRRIPERQAELATLNARATEFAALSEGIEEFHTRIASGQDTFELVEFVDLLVDACGLKQKVVGMDSQPSDVGSDYTETIVELKMESLTMPQLFEFLVKLRSSEVPVNTKRLHISRNLKDASLLDSELDISNLKLKRSRTPKTSDPATG